MPTDNEIADKMRVFVGLFPVMEGPPTRKTSQAAQIFDLCKGGKYSKIIFEISRG